MFVDSDNRLYAHAYVLDRVKSVTEQFTIANYRKISLELVRMLQKMPENPHDKHVERFCRAISLGSCLQDKSGSENGMS